MTTPVPIGLVEDHAAVSIAVREALERTPDLRLAVSSPTVDALLAAGTAPTLVVLDLRLADGSTPAANVEQLTSAGCRVLAYTSGESSYLLRAAARTDIVGIVRKSEPLRTLVAAIRDAVLGHASIDALWASTATNDPRIVDARLSRNEQRILSLFADGHTAQSIAADGGIAISTVEDYIRRIRVKYSTAGRPAATKVDLYKRAIEDGFLPSPTHR